MANARRRSGEHHAAEAVAKQLARVFEQVLARRPRDDSL
jgi:imidazoleglycerol phosphate dehydratase HisB